jgi:hypothetical protein
MIFQFTIDKVLSGEKCATSRLWKDDWFIPSDEYDRDIKNVILSLKAWDAGKIRHLYRVGQILSVQPARGQKGIAKIKVLELTKRDVRSYTDDDIRAEGFSDRLSFYRTWYEMHFPSYLKLLSDGYVDYDWWMESRRAQIPEKNTALFIRFVLQDVMEKQQA